MDRVIETYNRAATRTAAAATPAPCADDPEEPQHHEEHDADRGFEELRRVLADLVQEGSALGLTAAELFLQLDDDASEGIGRLELRKGLASLSVHLTETEVETVMAGSGCIRGSTGSDSRLNLDSFLAVVREPPGRRRQGPLVATGASAPGSAAYRPLSAFAEPASLQNPPVLGADQSYGSLRQDSDNGAAEDDRGCVTPDSLALRMSVSELLVDVEENGGNCGAPGTAPSSTAVAHLEAFGRVAADVQAKLTTAISGGGTGRASDHDEQDEGASGNSSAILHRRSSSERNSRRTPEAPTATGLSGSTTADRAGVERGTVGERERTLTKREEKATEKDRGEGRGMAARTPAASSRASAAAAASRAGPIPRTAAITPPFGPARSPSEPLHPTRASRERLEAALEGLDLKERLRPTARVREGVDGDGGGHAAGCPGARTRSSDGILEARPTVERVRGHAGALQRRASSLGARRRRPAKGDVACAVAPAADPPALSFQRLRGVEGEGRAESTGRAGTNESRQAAGVNEKGARVRHAYGRNNDGAEPGNREQRLGEVVDLGAADRLGDVASYDGGPEEAPELIGRLRARVAELELTEQLLRCELEGARADLVSKGRRAAEEAQREADRFRERERTLQAKMGARLRAAEAEAASTEKRMAVFKRASAAEAAAREKSSADYLRRRLKEAEAALEAKAARCVSSSKQHQQQQQGHLTSRQRQGRQRESAAAEEEGDDDGSGVDGGRGTGSRWVHQRAGRRKFGMMGEAGGVRGVGSGAQQVVGRLRGELLSSQKELAAATAEVSRLRKELNFSGHKTKGTRRNKRDEEEEEEEAAGGIRRGVCVKAGGAKKGARRGKACAVCGESRSSRERQRERERRLEARMAESEDARIEVEAEAGRLQAFLDEMRGLIPSCGEGAAE